MQPGKFNKFSEFYLFYLMEHRHPMCRIFHAIGTSLVLLTFGYILYSGDWRLLILLPIFGYGFSWAGHFGFERNKPAAFKHPLYSFLSDFVMNWHMWTGQIKKKIAEVEAHYQNKTSA